MKSAFLSSLALGAVVACSASAFAAPYTAGEYTYVNNDADTFANTLIDVAAVSPSSYDLLTITISGINIDASLVNNNTSYTRQASASLDVSGIKLILVNSSGVGTPVQTIALDSTPITFSGDVYKNTTAGSDLPSANWSLSGGDFSIDLTAADLASYGIVFGDSFQIVLDLSGLQFSTSSGSVSYDLDIDGNVTAVYNAPEPTTVAGLGAGALGLTLLRRRK